MAEDVPRDLIAPVNAQLREQAAPFKFKNGEPEPDALSTRFSVPGGGLSGATTCRGRHRTAEDQRPPLFGLSRIELG